ncbi:MAG: hypothetical protein RIC14_05550 [Filomicrobium sp.]
MTQLKGPDGFGFYYGEFVNSQDSSCQINLLPPRGGRLGQIDDPDRWIAFAAGEEVGRYETKEEALKQAEIFAVQFLSN